jgi:hypothetical protein
MRRLLVSFSALVLAVGCGTTVEEQPVKAECEPQVIDLSACDRATLAAVQAEGIWNMHLVYASDGYRAPSVIRFGGDKPVVAGELPITSKTVESNALFVYSDVKTTGGVPLRYVFAGCSSTGPGHVKGHFRRCTNGTKDLEGSFEAYRMGWRAGEAEASGVELVSELALPKDGEGRLRGTAADLFVAGGHAYVAAHTGGLFIYDVSKPAEPRLVASLTPTNDAWNQVWVHGTTAYIASSARGILVYDVSNPAVPRHVTSLPGNAAEVRSVYVDGNRLYAASPQPNADIIIYDITNPTAPVFKKRYFLDDSNPGADERPLEVFAQGDRLYVSHWAYGLALLDVSDVLAPKKLGRFDYDGATTRTVTVGTVGSRTLAFEAGEDWGAHLRILDVSSPSSITQVGAYSLRPQVSIRALALAGSKLYVAHYQDGLRILDVSNPSEPRPLGHYNTWREADTGRGASFFEGLSGVKVPGDGYVYATDTARGLLIFRETGGASAP